ncbi:CAP domain-containing protein [Flavobacterium alvei]|uniref:CAP domain-containing protein n=1 Tax=Flavobacterium alvei TaxID=2080416 RepID=UPI0026E99678|nr:CAP domain-containing protein [Flavobacterium alvei]
MKTKLLRLALLVAILFTMNSCSSDSSETNSTETQTSTQKAMNYTYNSTELETMALINEYRVSIGLNELKQIEHISYKSEEHDNYMITNNVVNHDDFTSRSEDIMKTLKAKTVAENIAFNYNSPKAAVDAWLKSASHKANIEGNFTHFGLAIRVNADGKKYYTNIFAKI